MSKRIPGSQASWWAIQVDNELFIVASRRPSDAIQSALLRLDYAGRLPERGLVGYEPITDPKIINDTEPCVEARALYERLIRGVGQAPDGWKKAMEYKIRGCEQRRKRRLERLRQEKAKVRR